MDDADKTQDGENEKHDEKEPDSEVSEDTKSGNLKQLLQFYYLEVQNGIHCQERVNLRRWRIGREKDNELMPANHELFL